MNYYTYIIYRLYSWRIKSNDQIPEFRVILTMSILHCLQLLMIFEILLAIVPSLRDKLKIDKIFVLIFFACFTLMYSLLYYRKDKWEKYLERYKDENKQQRRFGTIILIVFTIGTLVLSLAATIILGTLFY